MSSLFKQVMLALVATAVLAISATTASAQVEVLQEDGSHCESFAMINHDPVGATCTIHAVGSAGLYLHTGTTEVLFSTCNNEFEAAFNESGGGYIYNQVLSPEGGTCGREPCDEAAPSHENLAWPAQLAETATGLKLTVTFCLYAHSPDPASEGTLGTSCQVVLDVTTSPSHDFGVASPPHTGGNGGAPCVNLGGAVELVGSWSTAPTENHPSDMEVVH